MRDIFYSPSNNAFYVKPYFNKPMPTDVRKITEQDHTSLILGQSKDLKVTPSSDGKPVGVAFSTLPDVIEEKSKMNRFSAVNADLYVPSLNATFTYNKAGRDSIKEAIFEAELNGASDTETVMWRLADNSWIPVTLPDLREVVKAGSERKRAVWSAFSDWDNNPKNEEFNYIESEG